jgi:hypothetical protein
VVVGSCGGGAVLKAPLDGGGGAVVTGQLCDVPALKKDG